MKYLWTTMHVKNLDESIAFYQNVLGLNLERRMPAGPGMEIAFLSSQDTETKIELIEEAEFAGQAEGIALSLGFGVRNFEEKHEELNAAGYNPTQIIRPNPVTSFFFIKDPDGIAIQLVEV